MSHFTKLKVIAIAFGIAITAFTGNTEAHERFYGGTSYPISPVNSYSYVYYPGAQVYYAPNGRIWYWNDGYAWRSGYSLPYGFNVDFRLGGVPISLRSALPYREHHYVDSYYGRPWRARQHYEHRREREDRHERWREHDRGYDRNDDHGGRRW
ncbi:hypothetical protein H8K35_03580 [Undibacterium sp. LX40W]|uniref:Uncharacterized protein n=1 Tax=Undibacterium nitidum TaxID=2762298 RepID=A0A923KRS5_9BURK|nr:MULTISPECIES: hypothetical protein [Undibacterium]MBC3880531.1 hypothetical protein [Undibacterium nitidum]MBC3890733.1 hypothetical protein [Undibacterium sp. LX40W]